MVIFGKKEACPVQLSGFDLHCKICKHGLFFERKAQLNTAVATFFNFDWVDATARCLVCEHCGYVHWFLPPKR